MKLLQSTTILMAVAILTATSCRKKEPVEDTKIGGCLNQDSPLYNSKADFDDESCKYAYPDNYEITYHPSKDGGSDWDVLINTDADLILRIKKQGDANWMFESATIDNQPHNVAAVWTAPTRIKLVNAIYEWELYDYDDTSSDDFISSGSFNAIDLAVSGTIVTIGTNSHGDESQLRITYTLGE